MEHIAQQAKIATHFFENPLGCMHLRVQVHIAMLK